MTKLQKDIGGLKPACHRALFEDDDGNEEEPSLVILQSRDNIKDNATLAKIISQVSRPPPRPITEGK